MTHKKYLQRICNKNMIKKICMYLEAEAEQMEQDELIILE